MHSEPYLLDDILRTQRDLIATIAQFDITLNNFLGNVYEEQLESLLPSAQEGDFVYIKASSANFQQGDVAKKQDGAWVKIPKDNFLGKVGAAIEQITQNNQSIESLTPALEDDAGLQDQLLSFIADNHEALNGYYGLVNYRGETTSEPPTSGNAEGDWFLVTEGFTYNSIDLNPGDVLKWENQTWVVLQELALFQLLDMIDQKLNQAQQDIINNNTLATQANAKAIANESAINQAQQDIIDNNTLATQANAKAIANESAINQAQQDIIDNNTLATQANAKAIANESAINQA
ncbi:MAG: hypothetical protein DRO88_11960, partial [Promethearchaeia archaeon]